MIIATSSVNIDENTKLAEDASEENEEAIAKLKTTIDGVVTVSTQAPFNDGREHSDGDQWYIESDGVYTAMYDYKNGGWSEKQWDQDSLNVKTLSALTADLGQVNAGTINGVTIIGGSISQDNITGGNHYQLWADYNGFHYRTTVVSSGHHQDIKMNDSGLVISNNFPSPITGRTPAPTVISGSDVITDQVTATGIVTGTISSTSDSTTNLYASSRVHSGNFTLSGGSIFGTLNGDVYFEYGSGDSGNSGASLHAASFNKMSQLSIKRNIQDVSGDYALAQIAGTDIKRFEYTDTDNSQQTNIGPIIDDKNVVGSRQYSVSHDLLTSKADGVSVDNEIGLLMAAVKELTKRNSELTIRVAKLEREVQQ
ncbi:hypothetical protein [Levilactobacillus brevis]